MCLLSVVQRALACNLDVLLSLEIHRSQMLPLGGPLGHAALQFPESCTTAEQRQHALLYTWAAPAEQGDARMLALL